MYIYLKEMMKQLNSIQNFIYGVGACLILIGLVMFMTPWASFAPYVYSAGSIAFVSMQMLVRYDGTNFVIRRLRRQQVFGGVMLLFAGAVMFMQLFHVRYTTRNEWVICVTIAAVLQVYTAFRIPSELSKENAGR